MDQFGVLVESIGFKAHGKSSAPLADLKATNKSNDNINGFPRDIGINQFKSSYNSNTSINDVDLDGIFRSSSSSNDRKVPVSGLDDVFGGFDYGDSVFRASSSNSYNDDDDLLGLMKTGSGSSSVDHYDVLGTKVSPVIKTNPVDDLLGNFGGMGVKSFIARGKQANASNYNDLTGNLNANVMKSSGLKKNLVKIQETASEPADLLSDFGVTSSSLNEKSEANPAGRSAEFYFASAEDPFVMFERAQGSSYEVNNGASMVDDYLDFLFSPGTRSNTTSGQSSTTEDAVYDDLFNNNVAPKQKKKASTVSSNNTKHPSSKSNSADDFSYLFGMGVAPPSVEFQEIEGESVERRKARFKHHMTTRDRMNNALNEKNKRDLQVQQEQDERHRVAATLDGDIKRWSVGKEGNLRALLSSLQQVLWAGSGWQPISLTDLITSTAVKKAYHKATLCVHPDKVQQKGASVQQKYIAEKVFDVLKLNEIKMEKPTNMFPGRVLEDCYCSAFGLLRRCMPLLIYLMGSMDRNPGTNSMLKNLKNIEGGEATKQVSGVQYGELFFGHEI